MRRLPTPLHTRSGYSLLRGPVPLERLIGRAGELGYGGLALTEVNNLCAATFFHHQATKAGLRPIIGAELSQGAHTAVALVANRTGYENLCRIITRICAADDTRRQRPTLVQHLIQLGEGLHVIVEDADLAESLLASGLEVGKLWLELDPTTQSRHQVRRLGELAEKTKLPLVATAKAFILEAEDLKAARLLAAIRTGSTYDEVDAGELPQPDAILRSPEQLNKQFVNMDQALYNNHRLAEMCDYKLLPRRPIFPRFRPPDGMSGRAYLRRLCREGLRRRYGDAPPAGAERRLEKELNLIGRLGFCEYFLVVWEIVDYARNREVPVAGRGSGASSLVAYLLGITNVCPLRFNIPFERFLHEGRSDFPDLDVDFYWRIRDEVIEHVIARWGPERAAMVSTHNKFRPRSALRETAKAFGLSDKQISRMLRAGPGDRNTEPIAALSRRIIDLPHMLSVHPGGIVITPDPIDRHVPIQPSAKGMMITQFDKDGIEDFGLVKLDLLCNRNLSTVRSACELLQRRGVRIDIESLPPDDSATVRLLRRADTVGCNQLESPAMRNLLKMLAPKDVHDVMKALALIRPGAASIGSKETFVRRHRGLEEAGRHIPPVEAVLADTYGVMLYEDDVMLVAAAMTGAPPAEADNFRRAVQSCRSDARRVELTRQFLDRCKKCGVDIEYAKDIWVQMAKFNAYSFCRAHAASYAALAYGGAYLKAHHPLEFWTAALNNNQSMYPRRVYVEQAKRSGIRFDGPDINRSGEDFAVEGGAIRVGLCCIENLGPGGVSTILKARGDSPFDSLSDFVDRTRLPDEQTRALILCGAFDRIGKTRPQLIIELEILCHTRARVRANQRRLLAAVPNVPAPPGDYTPTRKYRDEWRILGFSTTAHPMAAHRPQLRGKVDADSRQLAQKAGKHVKIAGMLEARRTTRTQTGKTIWFGTFDDEHGLFEVTFFPDAARTGRFLNGYGPYLISGTVERQYDAMTISAADIRPSRPSTTSPPRSALAATRPPK